MIEARFGKGSMRRRLLVLAAVGAASTLVPRPGLAQSSTSSARQVGMGYKLGDGLGYWGADLILSPIPHIALDLQGSWFSEKFGASGFGVAPALQFFLIGEGRSTPYLSVGYAHFWLTFDDGVKGSGSAIFANLGYEWKWRSGLGILVGGGILYAGNVSTSDNGRTQILGEDGLKANIEAGVRYMFF
jgi:hypothetical protein